MFINFRLMPSLPVAFDLIAAKHCRISSSEANLKLKRVLKSRPITICLKEEFVHDISINFALFMLIVVPKLRLTPAKLFLICKRLSYHHANFQESPITISLFTPLILEEKFQKLSRKTFRLVIGNNTHFLVKYPVTTAACC